MRLKGCTAGVSVKAYANRIPGAYNAPSVMASRDPIDWLVGSFMEVPAAGQLVSLVGNAPVQGISPLWEVHEESEK